MSSITVTEVVLNFRTALLGLLPALETVEIQWRREDAYDEWDDLTATLYRILVSDVAQLAVAEERRERFALPPYDLLGSDLKICSWIEVLPADSAGTRVFHSFQTENEPFDLVEYRTVSDDGEEVSEDLKTIGVDRVEFRLRLAGTREEITEIDLG